MKNFLEETIQVLHDNDKNPSDVCWVGNDYRSCSWDEFDAISDFSYNEKFGGYEIHPDLQVVGHDWWLERSEYAGTEEWIFKTYPDKKGKLPLVKVTSD